MSTGGAFRGKAILITGASSGIGEELAERVRPFAARGYVAIAAQYRLVGQGGGFPDLVHDAKAAIRWARA